MYEKIQLEPFIHLMSIATFAGSTDGPKMNFKIDLLKRFLLINFKHIFIKVHICNILITESRLIRDVMEFNSESDGFCHFCTNSKSDGFKELFHFGFESEF